MKFTQEQQEIIQSTGDIKINAVAGSGKTTTVIAYAQTRPSNARILYLAFNKSVKLEAQKKFQNKGLMNVTVETAHSLAFKHVVMSSQYKVKPQEYKTSELIDILKIKGNGEKYSEHIIANHVNKFVAYFCNSDKKNVKDLNYLTTVIDAEAQQFVKNIYSYIESLTRILLGKMNDGEIAITHDFYLKKFQLSNPKLSFDFILFDEGQDASAAMLDIFFKQQATKVIVGDTHQQIYGWRYAVNSLEKADFKTFNLSTSFRFGQDIANLSMLVLQWKLKENSSNSFVIKGEGAHKEHKIKAVIARTNLGLLLKAIEYVTEKSNLNKIYFEGNINSYTYADNGTSLYDVLNLYNGKKEMVKDKLIKEMKSMEELEDYTNKTEDAQLKMIIEIVKEYGNDIPKIIKSIKDKHLENDNKEEAEIIFSTVHRCKGMEYDTIQLVNDFITKDMLEKITSELKQDEAISGKITEEINLLYVAITRAKNSVYIPETLLPEGFKESAYIRPLKVKTEEETSVKKINNKEMNKTTTNKGAYSVDTIREQHAEAYQPWTKKQDNELSKMFYDGISLKDIAKHFGRTRGAVGSRIKKLSLENLYK